MIASAAPAETTLALAHELRIACGRLIRRLREETSDFGLTHSQKAVLIQLDCSGPSNVSALAQAAGVKPQSMGATVASLQAAGLVDGQPDPHDGRRTVLSITPACRELLKSSRAAREDWLFRALQTQLDATEQGQLAAVMPLLRRLGSA